MANTSTHVTPSTQALNDLQRTINQKIDGKSLALEALDEGQPLAALLSQALGTKAVQIANCEVGWAADGSGVMIAGTLDIGDGAPADVRLKCSPCNGRIAFDLAVNLAQAVAWTPSEQFPFGIELSSIELSSSPDEPLRLRLAAEIVDHAVRIPVVVELPTSDRTWAISAESGGTPVTLPDLARLFGLARLSDALPSQLGAIGLTELSIAYQPTVGISSLTLALAIADALKFCDGFTLQEAMARVSVVDPTGATATDLCLTGRFAIGDTLLDLQAFRASDAAGAHWTFAGTLRNLELQKLMDDLAITLGQPRVVLPTILPDMTLDEASVTVTSDLATIEVQGALHGSWSLLHKGSKLIVDSASFHFARTMDGGSARYSFAIELSADSGETVVELAPGVRPRRFHLRFAHEGDRWTADGELCLDLLDAKGVRLAAMYESDKTSGTLILSNRLAPKGAATRTVGGTTLLMDSSVCTLLRFGDKATLVVQDIALILTRTAGEGEDKSSTIFRLDAGARLTVQGALDLEGRLRCGALGPQPDDAISLVNDSLDAPSDGAVGLEFIMTAHCPLRLAIPAALAPTDSEPATVSLHSAAIVLSRNGSGAWSLQGDTTISFESFPRRVQSVLPTGAVSGSIEVTDKSVTLSVSKVIDDIPLSLPKLPLSGAQLHDLSVNACRPTITVDFAGRVEFSIEPTIRFPDNANELLFGRGADGKPRRILAPGAAARFGLAIDSTGAGASFCMTESPFAAIQVETDPTTGKSSWRCPIGPMGTIWVEVPILRCGATGSFTFSAGFHEDPSDPLSFPLAPFKQLLGQHLGGVANSLPDSIPLLRAKPKLFSNGRVISDQLIAHIESMGQHADKSFHLNSTLKKAITALGTAAAGLPDRLIKYLEADLPTGLHVDVSADASGSLTANLQADGNPIMVLLPGMPNLVGLCIRSASFGPVLGGSVFMLTLDAEIDIFDPVAIVGAIAAATSDLASQWLPSAKDARKTFVVNNLVMFIVYETGVPIPIPLSFKEIGMNWCDPTGFTMKSSASFDPLCNGLAQAFGSLKDLYTFVSDSNARLPVKGSLDLHATIGETYLQLPQFLGGKTFGAKDAPLLDLDLYALFANVANGIKFFSMSDFLQGIPLDKRCGSIDLQLGPLAFHTAWVATTSKEFSGGLPGGTTAIARVARLTPEERSQHLALLPPASSTTADGTTGDGFILMLSGDASIDSSTPNAPPLFKVDGRFGMRHSHQDGSVFGVRLQADFATRISWVVEGTTACGLPSNAGDGTSVTIPSRILSGHGALMIGGTSVLEAELDVTNESISFKGAARNFDQFPMLAVNGNVTATMSRAGFRATGLASLSLFGAVSSQQEFVLTDQQFTLTTTMNLPCGNRMSITTTAGGLDAAGFKGATFTGTLVEQFSLSVATEAARRMSDTIGTYAHDQRVRAMNGLKGDTFSLPWNMEHVPATWAAYIAIYTALELWAKGPLGGALSIASSLHWALNGALSFLPPGIAGAIHRLSSGATKLFDEKLNVTASGALDVLHASGSASLAVSGTFAGAAFGPIHFDAPLNAPDLAQQVAQSLVTSLVGSRAVALPRRRAGVASTS